MSSYIIGNLIDFSGAFTDEEGEAADPQTVVFAWRAGDQSAVLTWDKVTVTPTTGAVAKTGTGDYVARIDTAGLSAGIMHGTYRGTGTVQTAGTLAVTLINDPTLVDT